MIKLNKTSYCHVVIRLLCYTIEKDSGMKLVTNLSNDFDKITFRNALGYITIDYQNDMCCTVSYKVTDKDVEIIDEIIVRCNWLELGNKYNNKEKEGINHGITK